MFIFAFLSSKKMDGLECKQWVTQVGCTLYFVSPFENMRFESTMFHKDVAHCASIKADSNQLPHI